MLPTQGRDVAHGFAVDAEVGGGLLEVSRVPQDDGRDEQVEAGGAVGLVLERAVAQLAQAAEEDRAGERVAALGVVCRRVRNPTLS